MQIQDNRQLLERASALISKKAEEFINKAIESTLRDCKLGNIQLVDRNLSRVPPRVNDKDVRITHSLTHSLYIYVRLRVLKE